MKFGQALVINISSMFLAQFWSLETISRLLYDFIKMTSKTQPFLIIDIYHFCLSLIHIFIKIKHWNLDIISYWVIGAGCWRVWNLAPVLQVVQKIPQNYCLAYINQLAKFGDLTSCGSKTILKNAPCNIY